MIPGFDGSAHLSLSRAEADWPDEEPRGVPRFWSAFFPIFIADCSFQGARPENALLEERLLARKHHRPWPRGPPRPPRRPPAAPPAQPLRGPPAAAAGAVRTQASAIIPCWSTNYNINVPKAIYLSTLKSSAARLYYKRSDHISGL